jgi:hypothetical protein
MVHKSVVDLDWLETWLIERIVNRRLAAGRGLSCRLFLTEEESSKVGYQLWGLDFILTH